MTEPLAKIELSAEGPRGPDVTWDIVVPDAWLAQGERIQIDLPRRLTCAACAGGGCDACGRSGALDVPPTEAPLELTLPVCTPRAEGEPGGAVRVRIPGCGAASSDAALGPGQLILLVRAGQEPSRGVRCLKRGAVKPTRADPRLALRIVLTLLSIALLFVFLLRFSGWL